MKVGGNSNIDYLIEHFRLSSAQIQPNLPEEIFSYGKVVIPSLEQILRDALKDRGTIKSNKPHSELARETPSQALFLLAHLHSDTSLPLILEFLSADETVLNYWLGDLLNDDVWEVLYLLGLDQIHLLGRFVENNEAFFLSRLSACTALVQLALNDKAKRSQIVDIFTRLLRTKNQDSDFMGLVVSELLDLKDEKLKPHMLKSLEENRVWPGIISKKEIEAGFKNENIRKRQPLTILQRFEFFRQKTYCLIPATRPMQVKKKRDIVKSI